ncbi:Transcription elongation factor A protein 2 [Hordeum vulgare]|nr:Transcription elongation factor A protein 2 [Hordeum vulgare]
MAMERELMKTFEAAKKASDAAVEEADGLPPEAERCLDALRRLRKFHVNTDAVVTTQVTMLNLDESTVNLFPSSSDKSFNVLTMKVV